MLRASCTASGVELDIGLVATGEPPPLDGGRELAALVVAMTTRTAVEPADERAALITAIGPHAAERSIGVCATFQMMNRLLDGVGAPVSAALHPIAEQLGFDPADLTR